MIFRVEMQRKGGGRHSLGMKSLKFPLFAVLACVATFAAVHAQDIQLALMPETDLEAGEFAGECKAVFVNGHEDYCIIVLPGTDTPAPMPSRR